MLVSVALQKITTYSENKNVSPNTIVCNRKWGVEGIFVSNSYLNNTDLDINIGVYLEWIINIFCLIWKVLGKFTLLLLIISLIN